jgi:hypothetical protein
MTARHQHVTAVVRGDAARRAVGLLWNAEDGRGDWTNYDCD